MNKYINKFLQTIVAIFSLWSLSVNSAENKKIDCNKEFTILFDKDKFESLGSRIKRWESLGSQCGGTGLYESRLAELFRLSGDVEKAQSILESAIKAKTTYEKELRFGLGDLQFLKGNLSEAEQLSIQLIQEYPDWVGGYVLLSKVLTIQKRFKEVIPLIEKALKLQEIPDLYASLAISHNKLGGYKQSVKMMYMALALDKDMIKERLAVSATIFSLVKLDRVDEAKRLLNQQLKADPESKTDSNVIRIIEFFDKTAGSTTSDDATTSGSR